MAFRETSRGHLRNNETMFFTHFRTLNRVGIAFLLETSFTLGPFTVEDIKVKDRVALSIQL